MLAYMTADGSGIKFEPGAGESLQNGWSVYLAGEQITQGKSWQQANAVCQGMLNDRHPTTRHSLAIGEVWEEERAMKYVMKTVEFLKENWSQIHWMAGLIVGLGQAAVVLASKLANKWNEAGDDDQS